MCNPTGSFPCDQPTESKPTRDALFVSTGSSVWLTRFQRQDTIRVHYNPAPNTLSRSVACSLNLSGDRAAAQNHGDSAIEDGRIRPDLRTTCEKVDAHVLIARSIRFFAGRDDVR